MKCTELNTADDKCLEIHHDNDEILIMIYDDKGAFEGLLRFTIDENEELIAMLQNDHAAWLRRREGK